MDTTFLSVKEMAAKLNVSEKTVYRMINDNKIPYGIKIGGQWRFNTEKIDKWMLGSASSEPAAPSNSHVKITECISDSSIIYRLCGTNRDETIEQMLSILNFYTHEEIYSIKMNILYKESIISSSIGGVSVMIADYDQQINTGRSIFAVGYLDTPLDFKAIDKIKTDTVILIIPANKTEQLVLSTRLRGLMHQDNFVQTLKSAPTRPKLIETIMDYEQKLFT